MSIRRRLVAAMLVLLIGGIVTADVVTSSSLRSFLIGRLDEQIDVAQAQAYTYIYDTNHRDVLAHEAVATSNQPVWLAQLASAKDPSCSAPGASSAASGRSTGAASGGAGAEEPATRARLNGFTLASLMSPDVYVEVVDTSGSVVFNDPSGSCAHPDPAPDLPKHLPVLALPFSHVFGRNHGPYVPDRPSFEVSAVGRAGVHYRAQAVAVPGGTVVTAIALAPTDQTVASVARVEWVVSIVVVLALLVLVLWIVRLGLRPLDEMTETAGAIAGGDLTRRVRRTDERSEVGRLGAALNGMLSQIEAAFQERSVSETRLRRFVADASHELRTPLTSIRGYAELLRKGAFKDEEARRSATERIEHEAARMSVLVDDLLLLARLDQGRPLERFPVDVAELVSDAADAARAVDPQRPISLDTRGVVFVEGDAVRLRQIVDNLLRNAAVHTPAGTPVHLSVRREKSLVVVEVADEGPGLAAEVQARVFDRFYRGNEARTGGGAGLGLSIVAALATAHGGRALVESEPGRGTTFRVELPALDRSSEPGVKARPGETGPGAGRSSGDRVSGPGVGSVRR